jgi:mannose-1-phosphate guanylyltransferase/mannose-6-phosphate isomerase
LEPELIACCRNSLSGGKQDLDFFRLDSEAFGACKSISIDYAVMEHTDRSAVIPVDMGWSDIGSWAALWDIADKDARGNAFVGDVLHLDTHNSYLRSDGPLVAALGVEDLIVVASPDAVLICPKSSAQDVKKIVDQLEREGRNLHLTHRKIYRPWGSYESLDQGKNFQVKRITVNPGAKLSLQLHRRRAEHWVVVSGTAKVTCGDKVLQLTENESTYIPLGAKHRLENTGSDPLNIIEVRSGAYLGEDDIVRFDDDYGR